ncbi:hypothetical protein RB195_016342 [Necator americanus]
MQKRTSFPVLEPRTFSWRRPDTFSEMFGWLIVLPLFIQFFEAGGLNKQCRELLACSIKKECVNLPWLINKMNAEISEQMYNDIDAATDYGCIFTTGCPRECTACSLCHNSKLQLLEVLTGSKLKDSVQCHELVNCATACVSTSGSNLSAINHCLRHMCAYHCFNGSCPKCAAFITKVFNQMCVSGDFRGRVKRFKGQCAELFREIVRAKFRKQFDDQERADRS